MDRTNKKYNVIVSEKAAKMLLQHIRFLAEVSLEAADNLRKDIMASSTSLQSFPERNPRLSDPNIPNNKYRKMVINKRYMLIYQIKDHTVFVDYILDCRRDYQWLL